MSKQSDREYYAARVNTERALAETSADATIAALHAELANRYAELLAQLDEEPATLSLRTSQG